MCGAMLIGWLVTQSYLQKQKYLAPCPLFSCHFFPKIRGLPPVPFHYEKKPPHSRVPQAIRSLSPNMRVSTLLQLHPLRDSYEAGGNTTAEQNLNTNYITSLRRPHGWRPPLEGSSSDIPKFFFHHAWPSQQQLPRTESQNHGCILSAWFQGHRLQLSPQPILEFQHLSSL